MNSLYGINAMCKNDPNHEGRFGRIFKSLNSNYTAPSELIKLGKKDGPMDGGKARNPSSTIPMGMVFFGQFIDHDITLDTTSTLDRVNDPGATQNFRTPALDLDCIYGSGPEANAFLYKDGLYLLTGKDGTALKGQKTNHRNNDLVRSITGTAIIGDPRNDENRIISQLQLAFINFHNNVVDHIIDEEKISASELKKASVRKELYETSRELVTWHYQWVVLNEFLPLMIGKPLVNKILGEGRSYYTPKRSFIPIEFSAAAYRFGHSLAPQKLKVQLNQTHDFELFGGTLGFGFSPISDDRQIVDWKTMFDIDTTNPAQKTDRLDTKLPSDLLELPFIREGEKSLANRNLLRGQSFLLPSGENIAKYIGVSQTDIDKVLNHIYINTPDIDLSNGVPLWYYILAEAECLGRSDADGNRPGEGLGPVGGTIVGETIIGLIELDSMSFLSKNRNWSPTLNSTGTFSMSDLLTT
jgi:hypothetical protein